MKTAILLIAHGSRETEANEDLLHVVAELRRRGEFDVVEAAFLELAEPSILEAVTRCGAQKAECIVLLPYFLSAGIHVRRDLTNHRDELKKRFPDVQFQLAAPLGRHALLLDVVTARAREVIEERKLK